MLGCIVAGYLKGGATHLKNLLVATTPMRLGFEAGLLLAERPADGIPEPHARAFVHRWSVDEDFLKHYRRCRSFEAGYRLVRAAAATPENRSAPLIDKTPLYLPDLADVMRRAPGTPVVIALRDPLHVLASLIESGNSLDDSLMSIRVAAESLQTVVDHPHLASSVYIVNCDELLRDPLRTLAPLHAWLGHRPHGTDSTGRSRRSLATTGPRQVPSVQGATGSNRRSAAFARCDLEFLRRTIVSDVPAAAEVSRIRSGPALSLASPIPRAA